MAFDGATLALIARELTEEAMMARVEKIFVPSRSELVFVLRQKKWTKKLLVSISPGSARIHFTDKSVENPQKPPMICMLLRKHLNGSRLIGVRQEGIDRILFLDFEVSNELGDLIAMTVVIEIMGRYSNVILTDQNGVIIEAMKRVGVETSSVRQVLPGLIYVLPPAQEKENILCGSPDQAAKGILSGYSGELSKAISSTLMGFSPLLSREIAFRVVGTGELSHQSMGKETQSALERELFKVSCILRGEQAACPNLVQKEDGSFLDYTFLPILEYGPDFPIRSFDQMDELLDYFYGERDRLERVRSRSGALLKHLHSLIDRTQRRILLQKEELLESRNREELKIKGDLLIANLYRLQKGDEFVYLPNYYQTGSPEMKIELDPRRTPSQNAQKYYQEYRKADTAERKLESLILEGEAEYLYLESVYDALLRTEGEMELLEIRQELVEQGYLKRPLAKKKDKVPKKMPPLHYHSSDGHTIWVGRNNRANDQLTLRQADKQDLWLHTKEIPGSHVIVETKGEELSEETLKEAAMLAAYHSKARGSSNIPVDYTLVRYVKKPNGAKPGMVIYDPYRTVYVTPEESLIEKMMQ